MAAPSPFRTAMRTDTPSPAPAEAAASAAADFPQATPPAPPELLLCPPTHFSVDYVINPWMQAHVDRADTAQAQRQWDTLHAALARSAKIHRIAPGEDVPDMVFTANAGLVLGRSFVPSRFLHAQRRPEEARFTAWFREHGFDIVELPAGMRFEGAGDALFDRGTPQPRLWMGHGHRSDLAAAFALADLLDIEVLPLRLVDPRFYHLDTCFCPLRGGWLLYRPEAFDAASRALIEARVAPERRIAVDETDALAFACNAVNLGDRVLMNRAGPGLKARLAAAGFAAEEVPMDEFLKAGGSAKCLTLRLDEARG